MPIAKDALDALATAYVAPMTSIRGRRVHRLVLREFARFDHVLPMRAGDGAPVLLALSDDGAAALCRTDGRGPIAEIAAWRRLQGVAVVIGYDLLKDSLPVTAWTLRHPEFALVGGPLTLSATDLSAADLAHAAHVLGQLGA